MRVIHEPPINPKPVTPPKHLAQKYRLGTIVEHEGQFWRVEWDTQDHEHMWVRETGMRIE